MGNLRTGGSERLIEYVLTFFATFWHQKVDCKFKFKLTDSITVRNTENFKEKIYLAAEMLKGLQPKKSIFFLKCAINDKTAYE